MSMDGSFSVEAGVKRFLARCPELRSLKELNDLVKKGHMITEKEVVNSVAELFLNPNYTICLVGCFRPIAQKIVEAAVELLRHCNLSSDLDDKVLEQGQYIDAEVVYVIEHYDRNGRGLKLHELSCLAFSRTLDLDNSLWRFIFVYFKFSPPPFERILRNKMVFKPSKVVTQYLLAVRTSYRLLILQPELSDRWNWSCFLDLVEKFANLNLARDAEHEFADIRWCAVQILSIVLKTGDGAMGNFGIRTEEATSCFLRWEEFCEDVALEKLGSYIESSGNTELTCASGCIDFSIHNYLAPLGLSSLTSSQCYGVERVTKKPSLVTWDDRSVGNPFFMTSAVKKRFEMVLFAVNQKWPVLLYGPAGAGKTALISKLAQVLGNQVLLIHMDDQIDGKTLIGNYVSTETPGEFRWQPGSLIQAVLNGYWVVFEDIDKASSDVQSVLLPLLEGANAFLTSHGEEIKVAESFRLFSTVSTSRSDISHIAEGGTSLSILWRMMMIGQPNYDDLINIVKAWYPTLELLAGKLIETFEKVNSAVMHHFEGFQSGYSTSGTFNRFSLRDLLKWCKRIVGLGFNSMDNVLEAYQCHCIYQEGADIFAAFYMSAERRIIIMKEIAKVWKVPVSDAEMLHPSKPEIQGSPTELRIGRVTLQRIKVSAGFHDQGRLVKMRSSLHVLERIASSYKYNEPVLLVGETGTGKTTLVQMLAMMLGQKLTVLNLSQQSDVADLLGGFKPMDPQSICIPLYNEFKDMLSGFLSSSLSLKIKDEALSKLQKRLNERNWKQLLKGLEKCVDGILKIIQTGRYVSGKKRKNPVDEEMWENFSAKLRIAKSQIEASSGMVFSFVEGAFVTALRNGEWILLDEVNLAPPETLQRIIGVLEGEYGSLCLAERGDVSNIPRHPSFRIYACMNPANDAGKRDLPYSLRSRFTEYFVDDVLDEDDLKLFINQFMEESKSNIELEKNIIDFYRTAKKSSEEKLQDGANQKPQFSLRSLYRALEYIREAKRTFGFQKAIYDGFCMFFLTLLDRPSSKIMKKMIKDRLLGGDKPSPIPFDAYLRVKGSSYDEFLENYVLTKSVQKQLGNLARAVFMKRYPVLLQGPTSSGKTSLVQYLAAITGHKFVRINNHEHTDLQEYLGSYISDAQGKLVYHEGALVKAVRNGYWIVLDELNLAPSDVLEALNRILDDNRELFVPELRETIRAHPKFMLFATQNPPTFYGGRKMLSRAFRNRFVEVHVEEIPNLELITIIERRCKIPKSRANIMVNVMNELQMLRQSSKVFAGKHGFITPRDLFRWANRLRTFGNSKEVMAEHGYYLLADRLRDEGERSLVQEVLKKHLGNHCLRDGLYKELIERDSTSVLRNLQNFGDVIMTRGMRRLYSLVEHCYQLREPVLLVGETGGGKTTVCQLLSSTLGSKLHVLNCHQYTETSDFLGGFYPIRERSKLASEFKSIIENLMLSKAYIQFPEELEISSDIGCAGSTLEGLGAIITGYKGGQVSCADLTSLDLDTLEQMKLDLTQLHQKWQTIFMWQDGPLVQAMKAGDLFLIDEISLADDSVLERLNSVLEPERKLSLAEKGGSDMETITAHENFFLLATMNPGGDYGKKELSPALRNRFTEIWVPPVSDINELRDIAIKRLCSPELTYIQDALINFWEWFNELQTGRILTVRDLLSWIEFIDMTKESLGRPEYAFIHGIFLVLLDGLSLGTGISRTDAALLREKCLSFLLKQLKLDDNELHKFSIMENYGWGDIRTIANISFNDDMQCDNIFGISPFYIEKGHGKCEAGGFEFLAPTTRRNAMRVLRAMQLAKPVLLEGSPGVGKTSLITALGKYSGHKVVRINLCEQTDLMDLLGSDLPIESDEGMRFAWSDGILLQALKEGCWVLLDELNLAPQSVLEGLNAILDHRAEVFIPELGLTFKCRSSFRVFACQNPFSQGGGRKGLPRSFLNRFTKVYVDELVEDDYLFICSSLFPTIPRYVLSKLIVFNKRLYEDTMLYRQFAQDGSPWEFNLRDVIRSCEIMLDAPERLNSDCFLNVIYLQRMRTAADRKEVLRIYEEVFGVKPVINPYPRVQLSSQYLTVGDTAIKRNNFQSSRLPNHHLNIIPSIRHSLEAVVHCVQHQWLCILIGPSSSGKTSLIRLLAQLTGNVLNELHLSSTTDISDLLGCFEQYNAFCNFRLVVAQLERYVNEYWNLQLENSKVKFVSERKDLIAKWLAFLSYINCSFLSSSTFVHPENCEGILSSLSLIVEIIDQLKVDVANNNLPVSWSSKELDRTMKVISKLQENWKGKSFSAKFEWVTGVLTKAIENGEWVVLENANLCNPTVLDRINSLVEPSGSITVNECGVVDGSPLVLHPHPNFRIFLTVDPTYGEVSRAMRNRGVEIFIMQPYWLFGEGNDYDCAEFELKDIKRFLVLSGVPVAKLVDSMAKAHIFVRNKGLELNVQITYVELARWVKLFQQLLSIGNQPLWSLHISWEHTYLCSLGETLGFEIINNAKISFLTTTFLESDFAVELPLYLPGGWPMPLKLNNFILYPKEASVKQNCMHLEYIMAQYGFGVPRIGDSVDQVLSTTGYVGAGSMNLKMIQLLFPKTSNYMHLDIHRNMTIDMKLAKKMLFFAATWTIEQASERDYKLYLLWFRWISSKVQGFDNFFSTFLSLLEQEFEHPIWKYIFRYHRELAALHQIDVNLWPVPLLSLDLVNLTASDELSKASSDLLCKAINCVGLLRLSYHQWKAQSGYDYVNEFLPFKPVLESLEELEREVLNTLVESPEYDLLVKIYEDLLWSHCVFWDAFTSSQFEQLLVSWDSLMKHVSKLQAFFDRAVANLLVMGSRNLDKVFNSDTKQSLLWIHGGHPILPASEQLYHKQQQLMKLCELIWPTRANSFEQVNDSLIEVVASDNPDLRFLAVQGICMSSHIASKYDEDTLQIVQQLEEMNQMLLERFEHEKCLLETRMQSYEDVVFEGNSSFCCAFSPGMLCTKSGFVSWQETLLIIDSSSLFLDMELLHKLSLLLLVDPIELQSALGGLSYLLEYALQHSLTFSSRPPQNFTPHQKLLWTLDAWTSIDSVNAKVMSYVLEMWYWWHSSLWSCCPAFLEKFSKLVGYDASLSDILIQPVKTTSVILILKSTCSIKDYFIHCLKLRVASCNFWRSSSLGTNTPSFLLAAARSLFIQIIYAHKKAFDADKFAAIKSIFDKNMMTQEDIQNLSKLIMSSSNQRLKSSFPLFIEPVLRELYLHCFSNFHWNIGFAWLRIGGLRLSLLLGCDDLDPAMKYSCKYLQLEEKISSLELEIKLRQECNYLAGWFCSREADEKRAEALEKLKAQRKRLQRKMVFRCNPLKFSVLKKECEEFFRIVILVMDLISNLETMELMQVIDHVHNWQETASCFIYRLSDEYKDYIDIVQPIQVAAYEMKLGLSLLLSDAMQKKILNRFEQDNVDKVMESIYSFMKFPRGYVSKSMSSHDTSIPTDFWKTEISLLEKLVSISSDVKADKVSGVLLKATLHENVVVHIAHFIAVTRKIENVSFKALDKIFNEFASMWMNMKEQVRSKEGYNAQQYRFRPSAFRMKSVVDVDITTLGKFFTNDSFIEWLELVNEEECIEKEEVSEKDQSFEEEWNLMQEHVHNNMIHIHNQLFGSTNLVSWTGDCHISDTDSLRSFTNCYALGAGMIKGLGGIYSSSLDATLVPEHLLRLCVEHERLLFSSHKSPNSYYFYKDSNASEMAKMVRLLVTLQQRIISLLCEWEDHLGLQKIMDAIEMLLAFPMDAPLAKALLGLQFLLNKARVLQENGSKFSLSDQLEPIIALVCTWQKMEFESWPALLDEVQVRYELNASKLWFPLFSVLHHSHSDDISWYEQSTTESLEEFIQTSSIGEFRKRLQLLYAFYGQITAGRCLEVEIYSSPWQERNLRILYNLFGYYIQFLPRILEHIDSNRRSISVELKELLKLLRWERTEACLSFENTRRTRQKLRKLVQKYTDLLQQPVMIILNQEAENQGLSIHSLQGPSAVNDLPGKNAWNLNDIADLMQFNDKDRSICSSDCRRRVHDALQNLCSTPGLSFLDNEDVATITRQCLAPHSTCILHQEHWNPMNHTLEDIFRMTKDCDLIWRDAKKIVQKKLVFSELLKLLENSGLQKHKFDIMEISNNSNWLLVQPSYDAQHLLLTQNRLSCGVSDVSTCNELECSPDESLGAEWKKVNEFYFKSIISLQLLQRTCLKCHQDITKDQATRSVSFLNHLMVIQQTQRAAAYGFDKNLNCLRKCVSVLENLYSKRTTNRTCSESSIAQNQCAIFKCMWKQKQLFDGIYAILVEESLLLKTVENTHLKSCQGVNPAATHVLQLIENFIPDVKKSKDSLDDYLLGHVGVIQTLLQESMDKYILGRVGAESASLFRPFVISKQMEQLVYENFHVIKELEEHLLQFRKQDFGRNSVIKSLLCRFDDSFKKGSTLAKQLDTAIKARSESNNTHQVHDCYNEKYSELEAAFDGVLKHTFALTMDVLKKLCITCNGSSLSEESLRHITCWEHIFKSSADNINLEDLCDNLLQTIFSAEKLVNHPRSETSYLSFHIGESFEHLHALLDLILSFGDSLLQDLLAIHKKVSVMTCVLANVLASLFTKGFGRPSQDQVDDDRGTTKEASGTGMGEGSGLNDVSDQITDEDQLLGTDEKPGEEQDVPGAVPDTNEKGIEMETDFKADMTSVSEDSGEEDNEDGEDEQLESTMGEAGAESEAIDEKLWNKEEDENPDSTNEKYESGAAVRDNNQSSRELRAKEDSSMANNESGEVNSEELGQQSDEVGSQDDFGDREENIDDMNVNKEESFSDPTGLNLEETNQVSDEDIDADENTSEKESMDLKEEIVPQEDEGNETAENGDREEGNINPADDEPMEEVDTERVDKTGEGNDPSKDNEQNSETDHMAPRKDIFGQGNSGCTTDLVPNAESVTQQNGDSQESNLRNVATESNVANSSEAHNDLAPLRNLPSGVTSEMEIMVTDTSNTGRFTDDHLKTQFSQKESESYFQKSQSNPYRNVGDAFKEWKERVKVSTDLQSDDMEVPAETEDDNADEYGYVTGFEKGTAQALGPATSEQVDADVNGNKLDKDNHATQKDDVTEMEIEKQSSEEWHLKHSAPILKNKTEKIQISEYERSPEERSSKIIAHANGDPRNLSESLISVKKPLLNEDMYQISKLSLDDDLGKSLDFEKVSLDANSDAVALWRRYELLTTRLSQELAEQLRLVLEPTVASKLQGDYKTGKRINMKKVLRYIASEYRQDKIWLRRTRPNKRDYQVVIAVDDSRSMSESSCGDVAVEALVTVCRAMSQLEMGNLAVTSFGKKGNIRLLHDFDQPFTGEAGVKIISSLTFKQENTIVDEPVVDLLKYLNNMLDNAVAKARLPSGHNPLQQLVLIIADGRFHEKEKLKRCVRDFLSQKRMVAFLLLDSPHESIVDQMEASFIGEGEKRVLKFTKYLDSFPFPYYIILRNIEALPRTLADLLRQWFELMQHSRD